MRWEEKESRLESVEAAEEALELMDQVTPLDLEVIFILKFKG